MHLNDLSKIYLDNIAEEAIDTDDITGLLKARDAAKDADEQREKSKKNNKQKKKEQKRAKKEEKQAKEDRREKLKQQQKQRVKDIKDRAKDASKNAARLKARATSRSMETIKKDEGDASAVAKFGSNVVKGVASTADRIRSAMAARKAQNLKKKLNTEEFIQEVDEMDSNEKKIGKIIDVMKGKNKIEVNPKLKAEEVEMEGVIDMVKKGAKRHAKAVEKKKIKNRKAVPYSALAAEHEPEGEMVEDYMSGQTGKIQKRTLKWMRKKGMKGAPGLDAMKAREAEHKAKRGVKKEEIELDERLGGKGYKPYTSLTGKKVSGDWEDSDRGAGNKAKKRAGGKVEKKSPTYRAHVLNKEEAGCETKKIENKGKKKIDPKKNPVVEAKVDKGRSDYGKATIRNWRHSGPSTVEPAMFDPDNKRGKTIEKRREEHKARRGKKGAKVPTYTKEDASGLEVQNVSDGIKFREYEFIDLIKPEPMKSPKNNVQWTEEKIARIMDSAKEKKRKNALQINKIVGTQ